jgi:hypothetical protein
VCNTSCRGTKRMNYLTFKYYLEKVCMTLHITPRTIRSSLYFGVVEQLVYAADKGEVQVVCVFDYIIYVFLMIL